jgi:drug/metabolite transporter (DMT)-like permease
MADGSSQQRARGIAVALGGVLAVSPDAMLLRWMRSIGASSPDVAVAKYIGIIACMIVIGYARGLGGARQSMAHFFASAFSQVLYQLTFTFCLLLTDAAKALLLISLAPLWAALFGRLTLGEELPRRTLNAMCVCMAGCLLVFAPHLLGLDGLTTLLQETEPGKGGGGGGGGRSAGGAAPLVYDSLAGDLLAIATGVAQGLTLTVSRHAALHSPGADLTLATALSSLAAAVVAIELPCYDVTDKAARIETTFWACTPPVWHTLGFVALAFCDALAVALFYTSMLIAPQYLTGGEVALVSLLEVVLGPLWVYMRFGDVPSLWTVAGGAVLLASLAVHECAGHVTGPREPSTARTCHTPSLPTASPPAAPAARGARGAWPAALQAAREGDGGEEEEEELMYHRLEGTVKINVL